MEWDIVIVGGGSAGCVLANRLSADPSRRVLLCEAGSDMPKGGVPADILDNYAQSAYMNAAYRWPGLKVSFDRVRRNAPGGARPAPGTYYQARVMGGGSAINGQFANRGAPSDYDEWEALGATGWSWRDVLPYFKAIERDLDVDDAFHGQAGRIPVRRIGRELWDGYAMACGKAYAAAGFPYLADQNGAYQDGYFAPAIANAYDRRVTSAMGYLDSATRNRPNLTVVADCHVVGLELDGLRCTGVRARVAAGIETFRAKTVILAAGALHSPTMLLRAGIGPGGHLRRHGVEVVADRPGVGQRLMEHPAIGVASFVTPAARVNDLSRRHMQVALRYSSGIGGAPPGDMIVFNASKSTWHAVGRQIASDLIIVYKTYSQTGFVELASPDPDAAPVVEFDLLSDSRDLERLRDGFRRVAALHRSPALAEVATRPFPASYHRHAHRFSSMSAKNRLAMEAVAAVLDRSESARRLLIDRYVAGSHGIADMVADQDLLDEFIATSVTGAWHPSCTCRMGAEADPMAVTDPEGRVHGIAGLRVCDASIFPVVPCANTNFPVYMVAEKIAAAMLKDVRA